MKKLAIVALIMINMVLAACSNTGKEHAEEQHAGEGQEMQLGDIREETGGPQELPPFLEGKPEDMQTVYQAAALNKDLLEKIPCYCGCGESVGHKDNYDCFIHDNKEDGRIVWDDHGTKCIVCLEIAAQSISDYRNGKSVKEIRKEIDEKYKEGYAEPTPTEEV
ncbi:PCYCGC motif-containing (lipo)protein [Siminovitchia fortis]|uniref:Lipoprotein n=1 Tax=Siminovitchia fortis TaxID=254758 RepID=A0A443IJG9_9BACI|nr:PCYCGC motif-containing (lipo)protein [Siminovitchia fortis]RWR04529.1 hypothetical protein D4N35_016805 [Siminovitchia fortis]WHY80579.1 PCYCGC motif-containing (lipo)protein [Siminovitchia fortis]